MAAMTTNMSETADRMITRELQLLVIYIRGEDIDISKNFKKFFGFHVDC